MPHALLAVVLAVPFTAADLSPLLSQGAGSDGKDAFDAGRWGEAAQKLSKSPHPGAAYIRALALLRAGRHADALQALDGLAEKLPEISDRIACLRAEALQGVGRPKEALAAWAAVPDGSLRGPEARLARAKLAISLGDERAALAALAPLTALRPPGDLSKPDYGAAALLVAGRLSAAGDPVAARRAFLDCWAGHPIAAEAAECLAALEALPAPHDAAPTGEDALRRAESLLDANRNDAALATLAPLLAETPPAGPAEPFACRVWAAAGRGYRKERSYQRAIELLRPVADACGDAEVRVRALYVLASAASIAGDREEGVRLYRRLARDFPGHSFADDALFFAADLLDRMGRTDEARDALAALVRQYPDGDYRDEARFRLAWLARRDGRSDAAAAQLLAIEEQGRDDPYEHARAAYWRARVLAAGGGEGRTAALAVWADLAARFPADYYGLLARARLGDEVERPLAHATPVVASLPPPREIGWDPGLLRDEPRLRAGVLLLRLGLARDAAEELGAIPPDRLRQASTESPEAVLLVADLLDRAGDHRAAHGLLRTRARSAFRQPPGGENLRAWRIAYPPAYLDTVKRWAPAAGVPVELVQALMREESALDPRALSPAGAIGLTQLMLPTARDVARDLKLRKVSRAALTDPSLNIRLGARYLGQLVRRFEGSLALALAAYNAGYGAVGRWLEQRPGLEIDEFVEEIPVEETRGYVKRVLRSYAAYQLLYGGPRASWSKGEEKT